MAEPRMGSPVHRVSTGSNGVLLGKAAGVSAPVGGQPPGGIYFFTTFGLGPPGCFFLANRREYDEARGRKSAASLTVISASGIETVQRPEPPAELTEEQAAEWRAMVNRLSAEWFPRETHPLLVQYCRHVVSARRVAQLIERAEADDAFDVATYQCLLRMQIAESKAIALLGMRMRITQHSSTTEGQAKKPSMLPRPWDPV
jgi:hypothetical protein